MVDWIGIDKTSGSSGTTKITITASSYTELTARTTSLTVTGKQQPITGTVSITQQPEEVTTGLTVTPTELVFDSTGETLYITITSNAAWTWGVWPDWVGVQDAYLTGGKAGTTTVSIGAVKNSGTTELTGILSVKTYNETVQINCTQKAYTPPQIMESQTDSLDFTSGGGTNVFDVYSNGAWTVVSYPDWLTLSATGGTGVSTPTGKEYVTVTCGENTGDTRIGSIVLKASDENGATKTIYVTQEKALIPTLEVSTDTITFNPIVGETSSFTITCNVDWCIVEYPDWVNVTPMVGSGNTTVTVETLNTSYENRIEAIVVKENNSGATKVVSVFQTRLIELVVEPEKIIFNESGGNNTISVTSSSDWISNIEYSNGVPYDYISSSGGFSEFLRMSDGKIFKRIYNNSKLSTTDCYGESGKDASYYASNYGVDALYSYNSSEDWGCSLGLISEGEKFPPISSNYLFYYRNVDNILDEIDISKYSDMLFFHNGETNYSKKIYKWGTVGFKNYYQNLGCFDDNNTQTLQIVSSKKWTASTSDDWIVLDKTEGCAGKHNIIITVKNFVGSELRCGTITFTTEVGVSNFYITQVPMGEDYYTTGHTFQYVTSKNEPIDYGFDSSAVTVNKYGVGICNTIQVNGEDLIPSLSYTSAVHLVVPQNCDGYDYKVNKKSRSLVASGTRYMNNPPNKDFGAMKNRNYIARSTLYKKASGLFYISFYVASANTEIVIMNSASSLYSKVKKIKIDEGDWIDITNTVSFSNSDSYHKIYFDEITDSNNLSLDYAWYDIGLSSCSLSIVIDRDDIVVTSSNYMCEHIYDITIRHITSLGVGNGYSNEMRLGCVTDEENALQEVKSQSNSLFVYKQPTVTTDLSKFVKTPTIITKQF